jgi:hypothetical protein
VASIIVELFGEKVIKDVRLELLGNRERGTGHSVLIRLQNETMDIQGLASWKMPRTQLCIDIYREYAKVLLQDGALEWTDEEPKRKGLHIRHHKVAVGSVTIRESLERFVLAVGNREALSFKEVEEVVKMTALCLLEWWSVTKNAVVVLIEPKDSPSNRDGSSTYMRCSESAGRRGCGVREPPLTNANFITDEIKVGLEVLVFSNKV